MTTQRTTRRRFLHLFSAAAAAAALLSATVLLAGCGDKQGGGDAAATNGGGATGGKAAGSQKLVIAWAKWKPADQLQTLTQDFTKETGIAVEVQQIPWSDFETKINSSWSARDATYDMIVGDSQWLGKAATSGHYVEIGDWAKENIPVADIEAAALKYYGEYDGKLYAVPCMADGVGFAYRKDLFEDPKNQQAFQARYNMPLAPPKTWNDFQKVAEFFTRPADGLYGAALFYSKEYDGVTMGFDQVLWSYGAQLSENGKVEGVLNAPAAVNALTYYSGLKKFCPPGAENFYYAECLTAFQEGKVAMAEDWFAFFPDLVDPAKNKFADKTGYFAVPEGPGGRFVSLGGQGLSVSAYSKNQDAAKKFMAWFSQEDTQKKWVDLGGLTTNKKVAATDAFKTANPYNAVFAESVPHLKDFYNTPNYSELLKVSQDNLNDAITGAKTPKAALDAIAQAQQPLLQP